jgi:hypothetical protein
MTGTLFLFALLVVPVLGSAAAYLLPLPGLDPMGRIPVLVAIGCISLTAVMVLETWMGIPWTPLGILLPFLLPVVGGFAWQPRQSPALRLARPRGILPAAVLALLGILLVAYVAGSARATSADLILFWGSKAENFALYAGIDVTFLRFPSMHLAHPDYPPLLTLLLAWGSLIAGRLAWGVALLLLPLFLLLAGMAFWAFARRAVPAKRAAESTAVLVALLGYTLSVSLCAGNGEPPLLFFEVLVFSILTFGDGSRRLLFLASVALAGAVLVKVEGAAFAGFVILAYGGLAFLRRRSLTPLAMLASVSVPSLGLWILFVRLHDLQDVYGAHPMGSFTFKFLRSILAGIPKSADYGAAYAPWIVVALLLLVGARRRDWMPPALVGVGYLGFIVFCYMHGGDYDPTTWIKWSADRLLLTPLVCFFFAATAPSRPLQTPSFETPRREW